MTANKNDLLKGNIRRQLIMLTLPLVASELLQQLYNTADSLIIGRFLGTEAFAATGVSGSVMNLFIFILSGFCVGVSVIFSSEYGSGDYTGFRKNCWTAAVFGSIFTVILSVVFIALTVPVLRITATPDALMPYCRSYLTIILGGLIATYFNNLLTGILRAVGKTNLSLAFLTVSIIANIILDLLFVAVLKLGIAGAAAATVLAQGISAFACFVFLYKHYPELLFTKADMGYYPQMLRRIFSFGLSTAMQMSSLHIGKLMVQGFVNSCGTAVIAAYTATTRIEAFINSPGNGFSGAESIFIAQNRGAGNFERARKAVRESFKLVMGTVLVLIAIMFITAPHILKWFIDSSEIEALEAGNAYLRVIFFCYVFSYTGYFFVGVARGYGRMTIPVIATTVQITVRVLVTWLLIGKMGLGAVAYATGIGWVCIVCVHALFFRRYYSSET